MSHFANKYIGLPWVAGAQGPNSFDCWGFARYVLKAEYGHDVPQVTTNPDNLRDVLHAFKHDLAFQAFYEVPELQDGDVVLMRQAKNPVHAGIWLDCSLDLLERTQCLCISNLNCVLTVNNNVHFAAMHQKVIRCQTKRTGIYA